MKLTNRFNLPMPLFKAVENDKYSPGESDYTTTQLAGVPARQLILKRQFWKDLTEDVADRIYSLSGQSKHVILERAAEFCDEYEFFAEKRFYITRHGKKIGGQIDLYDKADRVLWDWKETSVYVSYGDIKDEWIFQGNINRLLLEENGFPVSQIINVALYRDWKKSQVSSKKDYPAYQVQQFEIPIWPIEDTEEFITRRIEEFERAKAILPECSDGERWYSGDKFALVKIGNKKATKLFDTQKEATDHQEIFNMVKGYKVEFRAGVNRRCDNYCVVAERCTQFQRLKELSNGNDAN